MPVEERRRGRALTGGKERENGKQVEGLGMATSARWAYLRVMTGTILGGVLGFYVMHRIETSYKEKMKERLRKYEIEKRKREILEDASSPAPHSLPES